jgi:hypothetical protein
MNEKNIDQTNRPEGGEPEMLVNDYGTTRDSAVVVDEPGRTVMLTEDETIVIEKQPVYHLAPKDRPRKVYTGMWGQAEIATVGLGVLAVLTVVLIYVFLVVPSNRELEQNRAEQNRLEKEMLSARDKYGRITSTESHVAKLITSVDDFESNYLPVAATGRTALYQRLNGLIAGYGLVNTSGPDFSPIETSDKDVENQSEQERGRSKFRSLFPGVYVSVTLEGTYQNLRRFIRDVETGNEFVVISSVELEPSDSEASPKTQPAVPQPVAQSQPVAAQPYNRPPSGGFSNYPNFPGGSNPTAGGMQQGLAPQAAAPKGKTHGETVSLRIEMAAYFRRAGSAPLDAEPPLPQ